MDLRTYSQERIGKVWTETDHIRLTAHMNKVDRLVQDVYNLAKEAKCIPLAVRPESARQPLQSGDRVVCRGGCGCERVIDRFSVSTLDDGFIAHFVGGGQWPVHDLRPA